MSTTATKWRFEQIKNKQAISFTDSSKDMRDLRFAVVVLYWNRLFASIDVRDKMSRRRQILKYNCKRARETLPPVKLRHSISFLLLHRFLNLHEVPFLHIMVRS